MYLAADGNLEQVARTPDRFSLRSLVVAFLRCRPQKFRSEHSPYPLFFPSIDILCHVSTRADATMYRARNLERCSPVEPWPLWTTLTVLQGERNSYNSSTSVAKSRRGLGGGLGARGTEGLLERGEGDGRRCVVMEFDIKIDAGGGAESRMAAGMWQPPSYRRVTPRDKCGRHEFFSRVFDTGIYSIHWRAFSFFSWISLRYILFLGDVSSYAARN